MPKENKQFVTCEICKTSVRDINLPEHMQKIHSKMMPSNQQLQNSRVRTHETQNLKHITHPTTSKNQESVSPDRERLLNFRCLDCKRQTKIPPGQIRVAFGKRDYEFFYEKEMKCRHCASRELKLSNVDRVFILTPLIAKAKLGWVPPPDSDVVFTIGKLSTCLY